MRLPKALVEELALKSGDTLDIVAASAQKLAVEKDQRRQRALDEISQLKWKLPGDYVFDRDEANAR